ncbi:helix-turn-helix transcriptional regulator [Haloechinothrix sp. YIM 98757]|uniref:Helix-turn-helix transcriptional regulator n=2 Tax=Haloechinothrix aidingensis TaxID=2752311 RepID=A0A838ADA3_9PSEU|nr:helix-turn-helix transcriptional regulator [Haloechinothrix aidingensis]
MVSAVRDTSVPGSGWCQTTSAGDEGHLMVRDAPAEDDFVRQLSAVSHLFSDKWAPSVIAALWQGPRSYSDLQARMQSYSTAAASRGRPVVLHATVLTRILKRMVAEGRIIREGVRGGRVRYRLHPEFVDAIYAAEPLLHWTRCHPDLAHRLGCHGTGAA